MSSGLSTAAPLQPEVVCVDLDGTLIHTDMLAESILAAVRKNPLVLFLLPFWLLRGRTYLKTKMAELWQGDPALLPFNDKLIDYLKLRKQEGCEVWLTTASHGKLAHAIASHCGFFDKVVASSDSINLKGRNKLQAIKDLLGDRPFLYAGDSRADLAIWPESAAAIAVNPQYGVQAALKRARVRVEATFVSRKPAWRSWVKELRCYQWSKNLLIFVPMMLGHDIQLSRLLVAAGAFLAFSLCASSFYLLNDLLDLDVDRAHPRKRNRPFASGQLSIQAGIGALMLMSSAVVGISLFFSPVARELLCLYACLNFAYSVRLKQILCLDVIVLAFLYTLRILFGGVATSVPVSIWTLAFSLFIFLGLALLKRLTELKTAGEYGTGHMARRPYVPADINIVQSFASAALYVSVLVLALYLNSPDVLKLYSRPEPLWLVCILMIFWTSRMLILTNRGSMTDDPIVFAFKDRSSQVVALLVAACVVTAL